MITISHYSGPIFYRNHIDTRLYQINMQHVFYTCLIKYVYVYQGFTLFSNRCDQLINETESTKKPPPDSEPNHLGRMSQ